MTDVRLRPLQAPDIDQLVRARIEEAGTMANPTPVRPEAELRATLEDRVAHSGTHHHGELLLGIEVDGRLVGEIQARCPENGLPPGVYELGIGLFAESDRGQGIGRRAVALMTTRLFREDGAHRVQAGTDLDNAAMRGVLERLGFLCEGVMRRFMPMPGEEPHDYALYGITRHDFEDVGNEWI
jgi:[ribosomal protein S5]-alanine N-acetyltransferase